jgi:hypothetical protein
MKLLIILSIAEFSEQVREIMARNDVPVYSETAMQGHKAGRQSEQVRRWFAQPNIGVYSTLFFSFQQEETVARILNEVRRYNETHARESEAGKAPIHAYQVDVEAFA